jgi:L,D-transpeptidase YcbB
MRLKLLGASIAALIVLGGCDSERGKAAAPDGSSVKVEPKRVTPEELRSTVSDERVQKFYEARDWQPVWTEPRARELMQALNDAGRHAMDPKLFIPDGVMEGSPAQREALLTLAALDYADALAHGLVDPTDIRDIYTVPQNEVDTAAGLHQAAEQDQVGAWMASLAPQDEEYRALSEAYVRYAQQAAQGQEQAIQDGDAIRPGDSDPRVPQIIETLRSNGYLGQEEEGAQQSGKQQRAQQGQGGDANRYTPQMAEAVKRMQEDYGISVDGIIGKGTLEALNTGARERMRTLAVNMERRRWLERQPTATRIDVNTAAAFLQYWRDGNLADQRRVVVGQPGNETPALGSPMFRLVANPTWTVPKSIDEEEIAPQGPGYLARNNMFRNADGWVVQREGPKNALGITKFDMKNDHAIYLHDTPAKALFQENQRHYSHGCVRVHNAVQFAQLLAEHAGVRQEYEKAMATGRETFVNLPQEIPVRLLYHTAFVENGRVVFRTDPYSWDEDVAEKLGFDARERRQLQQHYRDAGP